MAVASTAVLIESTPTSVDDDDDDDDDALAHNFRERHVVSARHSV